MNEGFLIAPFAALAKNQGGNKLSMEGIAITQGFLKCEAFKHSHHTAWIPESFDKGLRMKDKGRLPGAGMGAVTW